MKLSIKAMHYFVTAVDERSIVQAARLLNVVPSAVSVAIDAVEAEFGLKLIQRFPSKGIQPTASGITVAHRVRRRLGASRPTIHHAILTGSYSTL
jgi:DNA-binding transcriptional LysR family regulator